MIPSNAEAAWNSDYARISGLEISFSGDAGIMTLEASHGMPHPVGEGTLWTAYIAFLPDPDGGYALYAMNSLATGPEESDNIYFHLPARAWDQVLIWFGMVDPDVDVFGTLVDRAVEVVRQEDLQ